MEFGILGPLVVTDDGERIDIRAPKQRALLALLLINANRVVSVDRIIDELWGARPPKAVTGSLQAHVSHLRRALEPGRDAGEHPAVLVTRPPGYVLMVDLLRCGSFSGRRPDGRSPPARRATGRGLRRSRPGPFPLARPSAGGVRLRGHRGHPGGAPERVADTRHEKPSRRRSHPRTGGCSHRCPRGAGRRTAAPGAALGAFDPGAVPHRTPG